MDLDRYDDHLKGVTVASRRRSMVHRWQSGPRTPTSGGAPVAAPVAEPAADQRRLRHDHARHAAGRPRPDRSSRRRCRPSSGTSAVRAHVSWVVTAYLITDTIATVLAGKFGDLFGRKLIFQLSAGIFVGASVMCALAHHDGLAGRWRAVQGIGAGGLMVTATALIADVVPSARARQVPGCARWRCSASPPSSARCSVACSPTTCRGTGASWSNLPIGILVIAIAAKTMPTVRSARRTTIDYAGIAAISVGAGGLTSAPASGGTESDWTSPFILGLFAAARSASRRSCTRSVAPSNRCCRCACSRARSSRSRR